MAPIIAIGETVLKLLPLAIEIVKVLGKAFEAFAKALGGIKADESMDSLGDKALQAEEAGVKPENYKTYSEYVKAIETFEVDPEKSEKLDEKLKYIKGIEVTSNAIQERFPNMNVGGILDLAVDNPMLFTAKAFERLGNVAKDNPEAVNTLCKYLNGEAKAGDAFVAGLKLAADMLKAEDSSLSDMDATEKALNIGKEGK